MITGCIETTYYRNSKGYGTVNVKGRTVKHHRLVYCEHNKISLDLIDHLVIRHTCDNPSCVNPAHLVLDTQAGNTKDMVRKLRSSKLGNPKNRSTAGRC